MKKICTTLLVCLCAGYFSYGQVFTADLTGYPLVTTGWNIGGYATVVDSFVELTTSAANENGYAYFDSLTNLTSCAQFTVKFDYQIYDAGGLGFADGIAFFYIADPPSGFVTGGGLGIPDPITGLIFTLDTWDNDGDGLNPESEIFGYSTPSTYSEGNRTQLIGPISGHEAFMDDGNWHHIEFDYNAGSIAVYFDYSTTALMTGFYSITIPGGYFGFSSSTGGGYSIQNIKNVHITATGISPAPTVVSPVIYCQNTTADTLTATGTGPFSWYLTDTAKIDSLPGAPVPNTTVAGDTWYFVRQGVGACISVPDSIEVEVKRQPNAPVISGVSVYCQDTNFIPFTVTASGSVLWYTADTGGVGSTVATTINTTVAGNDTVWATQTSGGCESPRDSFIVTVHATPTEPTVTGDSIFCQYQTYVPPVVTTTGVGTDLLWFTTATGGLGTGITPVINTSVAGSYNYFLQQSDSGCNSPRRPFSIVVNPQPASPIITDSPLVYCPGQVFVPFTVVTGINILWYNSATGLSGSPVAPIVVTTTPGTDTVWASQTVLGCESPRSYDVVTIHNNVTAGFSSLTKYGCHGDSVYFTNNSTGASAYSWNFGDISSISVQADPLHIYVSQGTYTVTMYAVSSPCADSSTQVVTLVHPLVAQFIADTTLICEGSTISFTNNSTATGPSYLWNFGDGTSSTVLNPSHKYPHEGVYHVSEIVTDFVPCSDTASATIYVDSISPLSVSVTDNTICAGTYATFTANYTSIGNTGIIWNMGNGENVSKVNPLSYAYQVTTPTTFTVTTTATFRVCPDTTFTSEITVIPQPQIFLGQDTSICKGSTPMTLVDKQNMTNPAATWVWSTGATTPQIVITEPGTYSVTVKIDGCKSTSAIEVSNDCYMDIPNAFTPGVNGVDQYFMPRAELTSGLITFSMQIYNRWGQEIFSTNSIDGRGWDGKFNNVPQPQDVYIYIIDGSFKDGQKEHYQGNLTLIR